METKHTPTPWKQHCQWRTKISTPDDSIVVALTSSVEVGIDEAIANAAFIVRACNAHDALVEAVKATRENLIRLASMLPEEREKAFGPFWADINNTLRAAIKSVKEQ